MELLDLTIAANPDALKYQKCKGYLEVLWSIRSGTKLENIPAQLPETILELNSVHLIMQALRLKLKKNVSTSGDCSPRMVAAFKIALDGQTVHMMHRHWKWVLQIMYVVPTHLPFFYPFVCFMQIVEHSKNGDVRYWVDHLADICTDRKMTVVQALFQAGTWLMELDEETLEGRPREILAKLRMHHPCEEVLEQYLRSGYQAAMHKTHKKMRALMEQISEPEYQERIFGGTQMQTLLMDLIYYRSMFEPDSSECPQGIAQMVKQYMEAKRAHERNQR